jgi:hypothetical protein
MILIQYSSSTAFGASEEDQLETMVEAAENHLAYDYGYPIESFLIFSFFFFLFFFLVEMLIFTHIYHVYFTLICVF